MTTTLTDLLPFHVTLRQLGTREPVMVHWDIHLLEIESGERLILSERMDITSWS